MDSEPVVGFEPLHAPDALQLAALVAVQLSVAALPLCTVPGLAANAKVGAGTGGALTLTVTVRVTVPPAPVHERENTLLAVSGPVVSDPDNGFCPDHPPDPVHEVALVDDQVNVAALPLATLVGSALSDTVGAGSGGGALCTATVTDCEAVPPTPLHESENVLLAVSGPVVSEPAVALTPDHAPDARHEVASFDVHVSVAAAPLGTLMGLALSDTDGTAGGGAVSTLTVTDLVSAPPRLVHVSEKVRADVIGPTDSEPDGGLLPDHPPEATQDFARSEFHRRVDDPLLATVGGWATRVTIGRGSSSAHEIAPVATMTDKSALDDGRIRRIALPRYRSAQVPTGPRLPPPAGIEHRPKPFAHYGPRGRRLVHVIKLIRSPSGTPPCGRYVSRVNADVTRCPVRHSIPLRR
ncbi:MAG: hypothetical protein AB1761_03000 [Pseudomonadota bacterium]